MSEEQARIVKREDRLFEQVVFAEVLVPNTLNGYFDHTTPENVKAFAYEFARQGYGLDVDHDEVNVDGLKYYVVESFIARAGDPDFIEGSWVLGVKIIDDELWQRVLDGTINGFSYDAIVNMQEAEFDAQAITVVTGLTEPDPFDGHTHEFTVVRGADNQVLSGGTGVTDGHYHPISRHTVTDIGGGHTHRYQVLESN